MPRRWLACLATIGLFTLTSLGQCKPPDLPQYQRVTVLPISPEVDPNLITAFSILSNYPIQILGVGDPVSPVGPGSEEISEPRAPEKPRLSPVQEPTCRGCPIQKPVARCGLVDPVASRSVLDNLKLLEDAAELVEKARQLAREGKVDEARDCLERVRKMAPGSPCEKTIDELMKEIATEEEQESKKDGEQTRSFRKFGAGLVGRVLQYVPRGRVKVEIEIGARTPGRMIVRSAPAVRPCMPNCVENQWVPLMIRIHDMPLIVALDQVRYITGCQVVIDYAGLQQVGAMPTTPVSVAAESMPLRAVLEVMLRPHRLQARIVGNVIHVTHDGGECAVPCPAIQQEDPAACEESVCPKCEALHARAVQKAKCDGKAEMVNGLMKACRLAIADGRFEKAADLARQAHALDPATVEADPMVVKLDLLEQFKPAPKADRLPTGGAAEEQEERGADGTSKLVPHFPGFDAKIVEALDAMLRRQR